MQQVGELGEKLVALWLEFKGYKVLHQRWRCRWGEIDVIAQEESSNTLIFVEVKTRSQGNWDADGTLAVNFSKQQKIVKTAAIFLARNPQLADCPCRFDVALISHRQLHYQTDVVLDKNHYHCQLDKDKPMLRYQQSQLVLKDYLQSAFDSY